MVSAKSRDYSISSNYRRVASSIAILVVLLTVCVTWNSCIILSRPDYRLVTPKSFFEATLAEDSNSVESHEGGHVIKLVHDEVSEAEVEAEEAASTEVTELVPSQTESSESSDSQTASSESSDDSDWDLYDGQWYYDSVGPLYTNNTCPILSQNQNCQGNGRPDKEYENWRWKPSHCELPRFNATKFLELMSGKTITFVGDSVARNQMESLLCILWQVEVPENHGSRLMQRWIFKSKSVTILRFWSAWLVHHTTEPFSYVPDGITKIHLDVPDETFMQLAPKSDVVIFSNGHWFPKRSVYLLNNEIVGTQLWTPPPENDQPMKITTTEAFELSTETSLTALATHSNYTGLTIVTSYSPDHYENGAWNTGGSCTGKDSPLMPGQVVEHEYTNIMHDKQTTGFYRAVKNRTNKSKLKLMDITEAFKYRHDGHPGPYRNLDPNKITKRSPKGHPPPQDCLHWCMPGPVDTWNEFMLELIRREFEGNQNSAF
ncbi:protein trichome birefringence-like 18 [Spinacia oleracea]|uniref:Protein trichome birefringence-like 18 n=1 Tax=Spinacia oleracea TaxID=3562 RepID=A0A9R0JPE8_SPIOL|nr:protein trichome birefringence-like 18 [Spinacia oleracea]